jgi:two-component system chemotaxis response regulator CheY
MVSHKIEQITQSMIVLVADGNAHTRRLTRQMLNTIGVRSIYESPDGVTALNTIPALKPDVMILDWNLPGLEGAEVMRIVRSPDHFPKSNLPVIMMTDLGLQSRVATAIRVGVHEFLVKPVSPKMLQQRLLGIFFSPRPMVRAGKFYIPMPRRRVDLNEMLLAAAA